MAARGFTSVARRFSHLHSFLCQLPCPTSLPPAHAQTVLSFWSSPRTMTRASSICWFNAQVAVSTSGCQRLFSTRPSLQDKASSEAEAVISSSGKDEKTLSLRNVISNFAAVPIIPMMLGVSGAIPFIALTPPFPYWLPLPDVVASNPIEAQTMYGAVILSFLGAPHWGLAMVGTYASPHHKIFNYASNSVRYVWSVFPSLLAWSALLMTTVPKLQFLICSFGLALGMDIIFASSGLVPFWYLPLRLLLSGIVILCLSTSLLEVLIAQKLEGQNTQNVGD